jgi:hypothetical protein
MATKLYAVVQDYRDRRNVWVFDDLNKAKEAMEAAYNEGKNENVKGSDLQGKGYSIVYNDGFVETATLTEVVLNNNYGNWFEVNV